MPASLPDRRPGGQPRPVGRAARPWPMVVAQLFVDQGDPAAPAGARLELARRGRRPRGRADGAAVGRATRARTPATRRGGQYARERAALTLVRATTARGAAIAAHPARRSSPCPARRPRGGRRARRAAPARCSTGCEADDDAVQLRALLAVCAHARGATSTRRERIAGRDRARRRPRGRARRADASLARRARRAGAGPGRRRRRGCALYRDGRGARRAAVPGAGRLDGLEPWVLFGERPGARGARRARHAGRRRARARELRDLLDRALPASASPCGRPLPGLPGRRAGAARARRLGAAPRRGAAPTTACGCSCSPSGSAYNRMLPTMAWARIAPSWPRSARPASLDAAARGVRRPAGRPTCCRRGAGRR